MTEEDKKAAERLAFLGIIAYDLIKSGELEKAIDEVREAKE